MPDTTTCLEGNKGTGPPTRGTILIVDDETDIAHILDSLITTFANEPYAVTVETSANEALRRVKAEQFDLVLSDFRMPGADGLTILAAAREHHPSGCRALMSGYNEMPTTAEMLERAKPDAYLHKPFEVPDLMALLGAVFADDSEKLKAMRAAASASLAVAHSDPGANMPQGGRLQ